MFDFIFLASCKARLILLSGAPNDASFPGYKWLENLY